MQSIQDVWIEAIQERTKRRIELLASAFAIARPSSRESILAEMVFLAWLEESCGESMRGGEYLLS
jgi:hypothetical protein